MAKKIPVSALYSNCQMMLQAHWGYIMGTAGVICTQAVIDTAVDRFPNNAEITKQYGPKWLGHMVTDCSGLIVYIYKQFGLKIPHGSSSMVRQGYIIDCGSTPHPGWAAIVDDTPDTPDNDHIGIVQEDGVTVVEAKGTRYGVVISKVTDAKWNKFGRFKDVDYSTEEVNPMPDKQVLYEAKVTTASGPLRLRAEPNTNARILADIPNGTAVNVYGDENGWSSVIYNGYAGFCSNKYLTRLDDPVETPVETEEYTILRRKDGVSVTLVGDWKVEKGDD